MMSQSHPVSRSWRTLEGAPATCVYGFGISCVLDTQSQNLKERGH